MAMLVEQEYKTVPIESLRRHPKNPRRGAVTEIGKSIAKNGFYGAIVVQKSSNYIIRGNHTWLAAQRKGLKEVPVIVADVDDATALRILAADNRTGDLATYDDQELLRLLQEIDQDYGGLEGTGYAEVDLDGLIRSLSNEPFEEYGEDEQAVQGPGGQDIAQVSLSANARGKTLDPETKLGILPNEYLEMYERTAMRQIVLVMDLSEYQKRLAQLKLVLDREGLETNTDAVFFLLDRYETAFSGA